MGTKRMELLNADSCLNKAGLDEVLLVLRAKDFYCAVPAAKAWFIEARRQSKHTEKMADFPGFLEDFEANGKAIEAGDFHLEKMTPMDLLDFLLRELAPETVATMERISGDVDQLRALEDKRITFLVALVAQDVASGLVTAAEAAAPVQELFPAVAPEDIVKQIEVKVDEYKAAAQRLLSEGASKTAGGPVEPPPPAQDSAAVQGVAEPTPGPQDPPIPPNHFPQG